MKVLPFRAFERRFCVFVVLSIATALFGSGCANRAVLEGRITLPSPPKSADPALVSPEQAVVQLVRAEAGSTQVDPDRVHVDLTDRGFRPRVIPIPAGSEVEFRNRDRVFHNAFSLSPTRKFDVGRFPPGESRKVVFERPGFVNVFCELHPEKEAFVVVAADRTYVRPNAKGEFTFSGLLGGEYVVKSWHPLHGEKQRRLSISSGAKESVEIRY